MRGLSPALTGSPAGTDVYLRLGASVRAGPACLGPFSNLPALVPDTPGPVLLPRVQTLPLRPRPASPRGEGPPCAPLGPHSPLRWLFPRGPAQASMPAAPHRLASPGGQEPLPFSGRPGPALGMAPRSPRTMSSEATARPWRHVTFLCPLCYDFSMRCANCFEELGTALRMGFS